jgi:serine protease Do
MDNNRFIFIDGYIDDKPPGGGRPRGLCGALLLLICVLVFSVVLIARYVALRSPAPEPQPTETNAVTGSGTVPGSRPVPYSSNGVNSRTGFEIAEPGTEELSYPDIYSAVLPSTLAVYASSEGRTLSIATAIAVNRDGVAITCYHNLAGADYIEIVTSAGIVVPAELGAYDEVSDIALMLYDAARAPGIKPAIFGQSPKVGSRLLLLGNPIDATLTLTEGLLSALRSDANVNGHPTNVIMTSANVTDGHSGAPLINLYGQVIGMVNSRLRLSGNPDSNISFAISAETVKPIVDDLLSYGYVPGRPSLGAELADIQSGFAAFMGMPRGALVTEIIARKILRRSDEFPPQLTEISADTLNVGDIITAVNGVETKSVSTVLAQINNYSAGDTVTLSVWRKNSEIQLEVILTEQS